MSGLVVEPISAVLPVRISNAARREALIATGKQPVAEQNWRIDDLAELDVDERRRVVELLDRITVENDSNEFVPGVGHVEGDEYEVRSFEWLRRNGRAVDVYRPDTEGESDDCRQLFFAGDDGRTRDLVEYARWQLQSAPDGAFELDVLDAMLAGRPLVAKLDDAHRLTLELVLDAYDLALEQARKVTALIPEAAKPAEEDWSWLHNWHVDEQLIRLNARSGNDARDVGFVRDSDPEAFDALRPRIEEVLSEAHGDFVETVTQRAMGSNWTQLTDRQRIETWVEPYMRNALHERRQLAAQNREKERYVNEGREWIAEHGSRVLQVAAARDLKWQSLYRDERLAVDLPGFFWAKPKKVDEPLAARLNDAALDLEDDVAQRIAGTTMTCRLVWVNWEDFGRHADGVYVEVSRFLGRWNVYRPIVEPTGDDDIPF